MSKLTVSSTFNLFYSGSEDRSERIRDGLKFFGDHGFGAAEIGAESFDLLGDGWRAQVEAVAEDSKRMGVTFTTAHLPFLGGGGAKDEEFMKMFDTKMRNAIEAMALLGVNYAVMHPNAPTVPLKKFSRQEQYDSVMNHLSPYVEYADKVGLSVVVENMRVISGMRLSHRYCQDPDELCDIADALGVGVCWDFGHANISGLKQSEALAYVGKRLKAIHVNDNSGIDDDHVAPFMGNVDWRDAMHGLKLTEYNGTFNFEVSTKAIPKDLRSSFADYLMNASRELISYIE